MEDAKSRNSDELTTSERRRVMDLAYDAGSILLENGDEISNVEETMMRIARHFGIDDENFFVLSNGIMATERNYARTKYIPIQGTCLEKVVEVKQLSRDVEANKCDVDELERRLKLIRKMKSKPAIASAAFAAAQDDLSFAVDEHVGDDAAAFLIADDGARGHFDHEVLSVFAKAIPALSGRAVFRAEMLFELEVDQACQRRIRNENYAAALAAVTAVGAAAHHVLFTVETYLAVTAVARFCINVNNI